MRQAISDLDNVQVLPSGKFMISSSTFSDYFNKEFLQTKQIDPSRDVLLFAREIAPTLGITVRFAGEEPLDAVTRQYNASMRKLLPQYGINFVEIPRLNVENEPISASRVRELCKNGDMRALHDLVPECVLTYLYRKSHELRS